MCAAIYHHGVLDHHSTLGAYNNAHVITFLDTISSLRLSRWTVQSSPGTLLGQLKFSLVCSGLQLVHQPTRFSRSSSAYIFIISQPYRGVFFSLALEDVWMQSPWAHTPTTNKWIKHVLLKHIEAVLPGDTFSPARSARCQRISVSRQKRKAGCSLIFKSLSVSVWSSLFKSSCVCNGLQQLTVSTR